VTVTAGASILETSYGSTGTVVDERRAICRKRVAMRSS